MTESPGLSYIYLTWGAPPVRNFADFWTWSQYRKDLSEYLNRLPPKFLVDLHYINPTENSSQAFTWTDRYLFLETDILLTELADWINRNENVQSQ